MEVNGETIETTKEHPFWVEGQGWTKAKFLKAGDQLRDDDGNSVIINKVEIVSLPKNQYTIVYNLEVADFHTYFVSDSDILVHNTCPTDNKSAYYEYKALREQGCNASEAHNLMKQFRKGENPNNEFAFHFTTEKGAKGITDTRTIYSTKLGLRGSGVYAGTTPTPSPALKHIPILGWGLGSAPVRIPIKIGNRNFKKTLIPFKAIIFKGDDGVKF